MTALTTLIVLINLAFLVGGVIYFLPSRNATISGPTIANDAEQTVALLTKIHRALTDHAGSLATAHQHSSEDLGDDDQQRLDSLRRDNQSAGKTIDQNNRRLATVLSKYGDLYRSERQRLETYTANVFEFDRILDDLTKEDGSNGVLLSFVHNMIQENRQLQSKVSDCQEQVADLIARTVKSEREARTDPMTQLPNRRAWEEQLERTGGDSVIALIDVDDFKSINDKHGHAAGDAMLTLIGTIFRNALNAEAFRIAGDEFGLLIAAGNEQAVSERICKKVANAKLQFAGQKLTCSISIGVAGFRPDDSLNDVLRRADDALYHAKTSGGNLVHFAQDFRPDASRSGAVSSAS